MSFKGLMQSLLGLLVPRNSMGGGRQRLWHSRDSLGNRKHGPYTNPSFDCPVCLDI